MSAQSPLWDSKQLAEYLGISPRYVGKLVREGRVPFIRIGRSLKFRPEEISAWVDSRSRESTGCL